MPMLDKNGLTEEEFLRGYNSDRYPKPSLTADVVMLTRGQDMRVLLICRGGHPCIGMYAFPGGFAEASESIEQTAMRELREETGALCDRLTFLGTYIGSPAILSEKIDIYLAEGLTFGETDFDEDEFIEIERIPLATLLEDAMEGRIMDGKTLFAVFKVNEILRRREALK